MFLHNTRTTWAEYDTNDLEKDPLEVNNLVRQADHQELLLELREKIDAQIKILDNW